MTSHVRLFLQSTATGARGPPGPAARSRVPLGRGEGQGHAITLHLNMAEPAARGQGQRALPVTQGSAVPVSRSIIDSYRFVIHA